MIEIRRITKNTAQDLNLKNEPFSMPGRMIPGLEDGIWRYRIEPFSQEQTMTFPDEDYDYDTISENGIIFGAYDGDACVGIAIFQKSLFKYLYLYDLKVCATARGKGIGKKLIQAGFSAAKEQGHLGIFTIAQDDNVNACLFYLATGFCIGGFDNRVYDGTVQEGKADIIFYKTKGEETL